MEKGYVNNQWNCSSLFTSAFLLRANTVVSRKYAPPFAILALVQNAGGAYTRDATISLEITPSLPGMKLLSVGGGGQARGVAEREGERCS